MKLYIADAFTDTLFGGNPAGVVILDPGADFPEDELMRKTAAELRYSETAFIKKLAPEGDGHIPTFNIRYFTPADEVDLCGHATIASFHCLKKAGLITAGDTCKNYTLAGEIYVQVGEDNILMDMATPEHLGTIDDPDALNELYSIMGLEYESAKAVSSDDRALLPQMISTGLPDIMMPVANRELLAAISPDFAALTELSRKYNVVGVHAFTLEGDDAMAHCRNFAPLYDIDEEAATGTSNGALTYYLLYNGIISSGETADSTFIQGEAMGRPSVITSRCTGESIKVGGGAVILVEGEIAL